MNTPATVLGGELVGVALDAERVQRFGDAADGRPRLELHPQGDAPPARQGLGDGSRLGIGDSRAGTGSASSAR